MKEGVARINLESIKEIDNIVPIQTGTRLVTYKGDGVVTGVRGLEVGILNVMVNL
ncbi:MAG TPA: hypothetical protein VIM70_20315 [Clostridium sp.]|uniref:hypothetical protein n=1 Tax=Clostridium sp. TaxID=1506 RepID=UPI002F93FA45